VFWAVVDPEHRELGCDLPELFRRRIPGDGDVRPGAGRDFRPLPVARLSWRPGPAPTGYERRR
jgi:hypothetical protein